MCALLAGLWSVYAQAADQRDIEAQLEAMAKLSFLVGEWEGNVVSYLPDGSTSTHRSTDSVTLLNNGTLLMIVGRNWAPGATDEEEPVSEHTALFNYDERADRYDLRTYYSGDFASGYIEYVNDDGARWFIERDGVKMRFDILNDGPDSWKEKVEMSTDDGLTWEPTIEISFVRRL